ncbi:glycoside hydrolase/deacetylase [Byssothecium circinans]|uniref:Glycoside hydrolase/deacetylase n=1 Tax=Byssothecium circinans TaxID=147558 RepID=A0A6A5TKQ6_9PLEO|nr:glycoside hydrolase/deacetylase [Byssothecium circinans]
MQEHGTHHPTRVQIFQGCAFFPSLLFRRAPNSPHILCVEFPSFFWLLPLLKHSFSIYRCILNLHKASLSMYLTVSILAVTAVVPLVSAHDGVGIPKLVGLDPYTPQTRDLLGSIAARVAGSHSHENHALKHRKDGRECGEGIGSCGQGLCCSRSGFCGSAESYCYSPGCNYQYGPGCPENNPPKGTNTSSIPRDKVGSVAYGGTGIFKCTKPGMVALTYDDGPMKTYTSHILDLLKAHNAKATFFITGNNINKGQIDLVDEYKSVIKRMDAEGHQIASHTYTHLDLSKISSLDRKNQMWMNEMALRNIVDMIPTYMRPPFSSCDSACDKDMAELGYHVTYFDLNGDDYDLNSKEQIQTAKNWFEGNLTEVHSNAADSRRLAIAHDILEQTANNYTEFMLTLLAKHNLRAVSVGECLGDPKENWYRTVNGTGTSSGNSTMREGKENAPASTTSSSRIPTGTQTGSSQKEAPPGTPAGSGSSGLFYSGPVLVMTFALSFLFAL